MYFILSRSWTKGRTLSAFSGTWLSVRQEKQSPSTWGNGKKSTFFIRFYWKLAFHCKHKSPSTHIILFCRGCRRSVEVYSRGKRYAEWKQETWFGDVHSPPGSTSPCPMGAAVWSTTYWPALHNSFPKDHLFKKLKSQIRSVSVTIRKPVPQHLLSWRALFNTGSGVWGNQGPQAMRKGSQGL